MSEAVGEHTRVIGKAVPRSDARLKATGIACYAADVRLPGREPLCGKILRSPHPHARIVSIDTSKAASLPGVHAVVTGKDATAERIGFMMRDRHVLTRDKVRFVGDPVAAVAAVDEATALEALALIHVEYDILPAVFTPEEALADGAPLIHEELSTYESQVPIQPQGNVHNRVAFERGDVDPAFAQADVVIEGTFKTQPVHHGYIEPKACIVQADELGKINVWAAHKGPFNLRSTISTGLGTPLSQVRVSTPVVGGDFGGKSAPSIEPICALLALKAGRSVKIELDGHEELATHYVRHSGTINLKLAATREGKLLAVEGELTFNCGGYCGGLGGNAGSCSNLQGAYNVPAVRLQGRAVFTNSLPTGAVRAPGAPQTVFAIESMMDRLARELNLDPFEIRRINAIGEGNPALGPRGKMGKNGLRETIDKAAEYVSQKMSDRKLHQGVGVACGLWGAGAMGPLNPSKSIVKLNEDGSATLLTGMAENGAGQHVVLSQVVAEVLGLEAEEVAVVAADTEITPFDSGPGGSMGTVRVSLASKFAAEDARSQLLALAAAKLEAKVEDLEIANRQVQVKGSPDQGISLAALAKAAMDSPAGAIVGTGPTEREHWLAEARAAGAVADNSSFCTHAAKVEVDTETGQVTVLEYVAAQDVGRALNPVTAAGQIHGAVVNGLGYALHEELLLNQGHTLNATFADYRLPAADTTPAVHAIMVEQPSARGPYGARGIGESSVTPVAAAIANAIYDAVGVRVQSLPITPEKLLGALREKATI